MKLMFTTAIAAVALVGVSGTAQAQSHTTYQSTFSVTGNGSYSGLSGVAADVAFEVAQNLGPALRAASGSRFHQHSSAPNDVGTAGAQAADNQQTFTLTGKVNQDCSFYDGGSSAHTIALNTIGVRTQSSDNVSQAFNQAGNITANFNTATAGCNTRNTVTVKSDKGGKLVNTATGLDYDGAQFTAEIPYSLKATWTGVAASGGALQPGTQEISWTPGQYTVAQTKTGGAWRSAFNMDIVAPAQSKGLVAGDYTDTITVTLAAS